MLHMCYTWRIMAIHVRWHQLHADARDLVEKLLRVPPIQRRSRDLQRGLRWTNSATNSVTKCSNSSSRFDFVDGFMMIYDDSWDRFWTIRLFDLCWSQTSLLRWPDFLQFSTLSVDSTNWTNPIKSCQMNLCQAAPRETVSKFNGIHLHGPWSSSHPSLIRLRSLPSEALQHPFVTKRTVAGRVSGGGFHAQDAQLSFSRSPAAWRDLGSRPNLEVILDLLAIQRHASWSPF